MRIIGWSSPTDGHYDVWPGDVWQDYRTLRDYRYTGLGTWERIK